MSPPAPGEQFVAKLACAAYEAALESGRYEAVLRDNGNIERHYGLTNVREFFAELTEAFFWHNDFFPFVSTELELFDPQMYALLQKVWGG